MPARARPPPSVLLLAGVVGLLLAAPASAESLRINCGGKTVRSGGQTWRAERRAELFGESFEFSIVPDADIALTEFDAIYQSQRFGPQLGAGTPVWGYNIRLRPGVYSLTLHFAEIYDQIFEEKAGPRMFHLAVGDSFIGFQSSVRDLDVYEAVRRQENTAITKTFTNLLVHRTLVIRFFPVSESPIVNAISAERTANLPAAIFRLQVNAGGEKTELGFVDDNPAWIRSPATGVTELTNEDLRYRLYSDVNGEVHIKQRVTFFKTVLYHVPVPADGFFDVTLHFAENHMKGRGRRVFDITVGDRDDDASAQRVTGFDIFAAAGNKMYTPVTRMFHDVAAPSGFLLIELTSVVDNALISAFVIERPGQEVFISTSNPVFNSESGGYDHQSHAVAGQDVTVVDFDRDGFAVANLDSSLSHSHFFEPGPPSSTGKIVSQRWILDATNATIGTDKKLVAPFPLGNTIVRLEVVDNTGNKHYDNLTVIALDREVKGVYGYFYNTPERLKANGGDFAKDTVRPQFGQHIQNLEFVKLKDYSWFPFMDLAFQARFLCNITVNDPGVHIFTVTHLESSPVRLYVDGVPRRLGRGRAEDESLGRVRLRKGQHLVEVLFSRVVTPSIKDAMIKVKYASAGNKIADDALLGVTGSTYDASRVQPTIHSIMPHESQLNGGGRFRIQGGGFSVAEPLTRNLVLTIHNSTGASPKEIRPDSIFQDEDLKAVDSWKMEFTAPRHDKNESLYVSLQTAAGVSNNITLDYSATAEQPISFSTKALLNTAGKPFQIARPTNVVLGPDLKLYIGTMEGFVVRLEFDVFTLKVENKCQSSAPGSDRTVLGLTFSPFDTNLADPKLYISTSTLFWKQRGEEMMHGGWANGKIQMMRRNVGGFCLGVTKDVITGLPVSNYDHGVNSMTWDSQGNMYIAIGSATNAGVAEPDNAFGNVADSPLSAAIVIAYMSKPSFNGSVKYDQYRDPGTAKQISGDVEVFASGVRNTYDLVVHSNGELYATSNSANEGFGKVSTSCDTETEDVGTWSDQIIHVSRDSYHGHPNRNRGRFDKRQCTFYSAETHPNGVDGVFVKPLSLVESSTDGIIEYRANTFNFQLRNDLFASKFAVGSDGKLFRMRINATTGHMESSAAEEFYQASGLSIEQLPNGAMAMPQIVQGQVLVITPDEVVPSGPYVTSVFPPRGPLRGGYRVTITGYNFGVLSKARVLFDGVDAKGVRKVGTSGRMISCVIPRGISAGHIIVQVRTPEGISPTIGKDFEYLEKER